MSIEDDQSEVCGLFDVAKDDLSVKVQRIIDGMLDDWSDMYEEDEVDSDCLRDMLDEITDVILDNVKERKKYDKQIPWFYK